ncbi:CBS domain-containing protein, partial [Ralstonia pickettii]|nr:CBS domain-containing protein [Ralstonia pickettii]
LDRPVSEVMSHPVLTLEANTPLGEAAMKFKQSGVRHFVVVRDSAPIGVLTQTDVVVNQGPEFFLHLKPIESIRIHPPVVVSEQVALHDVIARMRTQRLDAILVGYDDGEHGILTERDIVRLLAEGASEGAVGAYASKPLQMLSAKQSLYTAQRFMTEHNMRHVGIRDEA